MSELVIVSVCIVRAVKGEERVASGDHARARSQFAFDDFPAGARFESTE